MPTKADWKSLASETWNALEGDDVVDLYKVDWRQAKGVLLAEHRDELEENAGRVRRVLREANAVLFSLAKRLAPARRVAFAACAFVVLLAAVTPPHEDPSGRGVTGLFSFYLLAGTFGVMTVLLAVELVDKLRFRDELVLARDLQADLVLREAPEIEGFSLGAFNRIANTVGGDLYEFERLPDGRLAVLFGDASGHGMAAGLVMAVVNAAFRTQVGADPSPATVVATLNRLLCRSAAHRTTGPRSFFAGVALLLEPGGAFRVVVAGHPAVLVVAPDGTVRTRLGQGSYPMGIKDSTVWREESGTLAPGETLFLYSDGLPEARNAAGVEFGDGRVEASVLAAAGRTPRETVRRVADDLARFLGRTPPEDDVSIAAIARAA